MANQPRMLREMLAKILSRPAQVDVIGEVTRLSRLPQVVEVQQPDWVVLTLCEDGSFPAIADTVTDRSPETGILGVDRKGEQIRARYRKATFEGLALKELATLLKRSVSALPDKHHSSGRLVIST